MTFMVQSSHQSHGGREQLPPTLFGKSGSALNERKQKKPRLGVEPNRGEMLIELLLGLLILRKDGRSVLILDAQIQRVARHAASIIL